MSKHEFDPGYTGLSTRCNQLVVHPPETYASECGLPKGNRVHFQPEENCAGCLTGYDIGLPSSGVAYAHPECPVHGDTEDVPLTPEEEEMAQEDPARQAYRDFDRLDASTLGLMSLLNANWEERRG